MKTAIICFSQTGNTRTVAEQIRDGILESAGHCDLLALDEIDSVALEDYDLLGLGCPVFYFKEPFNVRDFMEGLPEQGGKHWFVFCTHGSVMGQALYSMAECLERKGALVLGSHHTYAGIAVPYYPRHTLTSGHPDNRDLREAFGFGKSIAECSCAVSAGDRSCITRTSPAPEGWVRDEAAMFTPDFLAKVIPRLSVNMDSCVQCGECEGACPVDGIDVRANPPRIQDPCIYCLHCANICPTCSIEADWSRLVKVAPANYVRYRQALNDAVSRGEFRWLIDPDTVDCSFPLYKERQQKINDD